MKLETGAGNFALQKRVIEKKRHPCDTRVILHRCQKLASLEFYLYLW